MPYPIKATTTSQGRPKTFTYFLRTTCLPAASFFFFFEMLAHWGWHNTLERQCYPTLAKLRQKLKLCNQTNLSAITNMNTVTILLQNLNQLVANPMYYFVYNNTYILCANFTNGYIKIYYTTGKSYMMDGQVKIHYDLQSSNSGHNS